MTTTTTDAVEFFYEHAGWSHNPETETSEEGRRRGAEHLAKMERWAHEADVTFNWEADWEVGDHKKEYGEVYENGGPETCEMCAAYFEGEVGASLCCIDDATDEYRRVVEAELASELWADLYGEKKTFLRYETDTTESTLESVRAALFGVLVELAQPHVKHYQSDLYHDARWIREHVSGPLDFFFAVADTGTEIGTDEALVRQIRPIAWKVTLTRSGSGKWEATTTRLP